MQKACVHDVTGSAYSGDVDKTGPFYCGADRRRRQLQTGLLWAGIRPVMHYSEILDPE